MIRISEMQRQAQLPERIHVYARLPAPGSYPSLPTLYALASVASKLQQGAYQILGKDPDGWERMVEVGGPSAPQTMNIA